MRRIATRPKSAYTKRCVHDRGRDGRHHQPVPIVRRLGRHRRYSLNQARRKRASEHLPHRAPGRDAVNRRPAHDPARRTGCGPGRFARLRSPASPTSCRRDREPLKRCTRCPSCNSLADFDLTLDGRCAAPNRSTQGTT